MITVELNKIDYAPKSASEILRFLRARAKYGTENDEWMKYAQWLFDNKIDAYTASSGSIHFVNEEDATAFKLTFGL